MSYSKSPSRLSSPFRGLWQSLNTASDKLLQFAYPPFCKNCDEPLSHITHLFCPACQEQIIPLEPPNHCAYCFDKTPQILCAHCMRHPIPFAAKAACFERIGPITALHTTHHGRVMGAWLFHLFSRLDWPNFDCIYPHDKQLARQFCVYTKLPLTRYPKEGMRILMVSARLQKKRPIRAFPKDIYNLAFFK